MSRDRRDFTEEEYKKELSMHHVKLERGQSAIALYRKQPTSVTGHPQTGVFRDFANFGVHPARVVVQSITLTIPFLVSALSADQLALEITNQLRRKPEDRKTPESKWAEEDEAAERVLIITETGQVRQSPSPDAAFALIQLLQKRKSHIEWTPAVRYYMSALNLFLFRIGTLGDLPPSYITPPRERAMYDLTGLITKKVASAELEQRMLKDPGHWADTSPEKATLAGIASLIGDLMTEEVYSSSMREIIEWYKMAYIMQQSWYIVRNVIDSNRKTMIMTVRVLGSLTTAPVRGASY